MKNMSIVESKQKPKINLETLLRRRAPNSSSAEQVFAAFVVDAYDSNGRDIEATITTLKLNHLINEDNVRKIISEVQAHEEVEEKTVSEPEAAIVPVVEEEEEKEAEVVEPAKTKNSSSKKKK